MMVAALERSEDGDTESLAEAQSLLRDCHAKLRDMKSRIDQYRVCW